MTQIGGKPARSSRTHTQPHTALVKHISKKKLTVTEAIGSVGKHGSAGEMSSVDCDGDGWSLEGSDPSCAKY